jgi:hypothetical protein
VLKRLESRLHIGQPLGLSDQHLISLARNLNDTTIGWIAFSTGSGTTNGSAYDIGLGNDGSNDGVGQTTHIINYAFGQTPVIVVSKPATIMVVVTI